MKKLTNLMLAVLLLCLLNPVFASEKKVEVGYVAVIDDFVSTAKNEAGEFVYIARLDEVIAKSKVRPAWLQFPVFPGDTADLKIDGDIDELVKRIKQRDVTPTPILMLDVDILDKAQRARAVEVLYNGLMWANKHEMTICSGTSFEKWLNGKPALTGKALVEAKQYLAGVHAEAIQKALDAGCKVEHYDKEYLRKPEFSTFTNAADADDVGALTNEKLGRRFVRGIDDGAHAGNSSLTEDEINVVRARQAKAGRYGIVHFSQMDTRGKPPVDGYAERALRFACQHGDPSIVLAEVFPPEIDNLKPLRDAKVGFGVKTFEDRTDVIVYCLERIDTILRAEAVKGHIDYGELRK